MEDERKRKLRKYLFIGVFAIYIIFNIVWIIVVRPPVVGDAGTVCDLAESFYLGDLKFLTERNFYAGMPLTYYMQGYHQQIPLAFIFSIFFKIVHCPVRDFLRIFNVFSDILIIIMVYKISKHLSKEYKVNKVLTLLLILTFISLPMLSTFVYGDIPGLALSLAATYFMMKYTDLKKIKYAIYASIFAMFAYMFRMNSLIFVIATVMYLAIHLFKGITKRGYKKNLYGSLIIIMYVIIATTPSTILKGYYLNKYDLDKDKAYPNSSYILMAMEESRRGNGWYSEERGEFALKNIEESTKKYPEEIKARLKYFSENLGYAFNFYTMKITSMWAENTYSGINVNTVVGYYELENISEALTFYQKVSLILICLCTLIVLIQNRKNISLDIIFLITIFIGGFAFHILWEAKSRYIVPYIVVLIPVAGVAINKFKICNKIKNMWQQKIKRISK